ncbi:response regulator [Actinokineospora guangxiensis]|uniref:Response regulator n=1 Tax=Actinokineospora guangxiensis TaxID=1490288 RepID=A0ABW0ES41_9PSEU
MNRLLVVDDDPDIRVLLTLSLDGTGWAVATASGGTAALAACAAGEADALLLDLEMPGVSGRDVLDSLAGSVPIVVITAFHDPVLVGELLALGALAVLGKPFDPARLAGDVAAALGWLTTTPDPPPAPRQAA